MYATKLVIFLVLIMNDPRMQLCFNVSDSNVLYIMTLETSIETFAITRVDYKMRLSEGAAPTSPHT